jgi:hypothetical protein
MTMLTKSYKGFWLHFNSDNGTVRVQTPSHKTLGTFKTERTAQKHVRDAIQAAAASLAAAGLEGYERYENPAPRTGTKRPRRVSQITKKAPTTRLVARRRANSKAGYFPNPSKREIQSAIHDEFPQFVKVGFQGKGGETAGIVVPSYVVGTGTFASISRLFPFYEANKMERLYVSDPFPTFEKAFAAKLNFRKSK